MRLLLAVSADGYLALGPQDDMRWTGPIDKAVFRLLTLSSGNDTLYAGSRTFDQMPKLPGRRLERLSRSGKTVASAANTDRHSWLIGGGEVALEALRQGLIDRAFICVSPVVLGSGIPFAPLASLMPDPQYTIKVGDVKVMVYTEDQLWPAR
ncbi:putative dihydrofolate reductase [Xanthomonas phage Elanor]|uniref:Dihydrofolate reductase n=1 Tax=Xanthomonas phage Elanor TaxID=2939127 RepID=A0A9E7E1A2_9CAUD|nr:putative dihydrofolate reductase [Xanthomonas phage Elanor]URA07027.1 putative dihydrofolate reductase [Xanthomonas phage Elanor]